MLDKATRRSLELKLKIVFETILGEKPIEEIALKHNIQPEKVSQWKDAVLELFSMLLGENREAISKEDAIALLRKNDQLFQTYFYGKAVLDNNDNLIKIVEFAIDTEEHNNQIEALDSKVYMDETLFSCIKALTDTEDLQQAIEKTLAIVCEYYEGDRGYIFELSEDGSALNNTYEWCAPGAIPEIERLQNQDPKTAAVWFESFEKYGYYIISNLYDKAHRESIIFDVLAVQDVQSLIAVP